MGCRTLPEGRLERLTAVSHHIAELRQPAAQPAGAVRRARRRSPTRPACTCRRSPSAKDAYEHVDPELGRQRHPLRRSARWPAGRRSRSRPRSSAWPIDGAAVNQVIDDLKRLEHEGYHFEAADASLELLMRRAAGWEQEFFRVESMRVITDELPERRLHHRGHGQGVGAATGDDAERYVHTAEGNGPVNAIDTALRAAVGAALPAARPRPPHRLQGAHPRRRHGHRRRHPRADRRHRRRALVDHDRRQRRTSSRRRGRRSPTRSSSACCTRPPRPRPSRTGAWPRPSSCPLSPVDKPRTYESPDHVPEAWTPDRPGELGGPPARGRAARLPGSRPGLRAAAGRALPRSAAAATGRGRR